MKDFFTPMKIPQKWVCLLAMSFVFGQQAFSSENYVTESIAVSADIMQQKSKTVVPSFEREYRGLEERGRDRYLFHADA